MLLLLYALWIVLNGKLTLEIALIGIPVVGIVYFIMNRFFGYKIKDDPSLFKKAGYLLQYCVVLFKEIISANIAMMKIIYNKSIPLNQTIVYFDCDLQGDFTKALLANAITLTPGTFTVSVDESTFTVHCLDADMLTDTENGKLINILRKMEG